MKSLLCVLLFIPLFSFATVSDAKKLYGQKNYKESFKIFEKHAIRGEVISQYFMGTFYDFGYYVEQDFEKALYWYEKSANQGDEDALFMMGQIYFEPGKFHDLEKSTNILQELSQNGYEKASYRLFYKTMKGHLTWDGEQDEIDSLMTYYAFLAAEQGYVEAKPYAAKMVLNVNLEKGIRMLEELTNHEDRAVRRNANYILSEVYHSKQYGKYDKWKSAMYYRASFQ